MQPIAKSVNQAALLETKRKKEEEEERIMTMQRVSREIAGRTLTMETGRMAKQANGAVLLQYGETVVLSAAVAKSEPDPSKDFFPLMVDYREKTYAAGKIPGGFFKREGRPTEKEVLTSRLTDRPIRSLFPDEFKNEVNITVTVVAVDGENPSDIPSMTAASASLVVSDIPFPSPMAGVRVGLVDGNFVAYPTFEEMQTSDLDLILAGTKEKIVMIEAGAKEISEEKMTEAIKFGHEVIKQIVELQEELAGKVNKAKMEIVQPEVPADIVEKVKAAVAGEFEKIFVPSLKQDQSVATKKLFEEKVLPQFDQDAEDFNAGLVKSVFGDLEKKYVRELVLGEGKRPDGRQERDIRQITCEVGVLPRVHGSALFTRGQTQSLSVTTLGSGDDRQIIDALEGESYREFMLHYNFPSFSVGETGPNRGPGRREIGHGALAERALKQVLPSQETFPYVVRLVSDILESNGSSSMATVCGGTLALMDAGVPITAPVAGIAIGLVTAADGRWKVLTDIAGIEDHLGDMDFKAAGTEKGLTALQMDLKISGITDDILAEAFDQAKEARMKILGMIKAAIAEPRQDLSQYAPRITTVKIDPSRIGELIGPGGKNIRKLTEETGAKISVEDDGTVQVASNDAKASQDAVGRIQAMFEEPEIGKVYDATVKKLTSFGAFCEFIPGRDGLCHVSEVTEGFVKSVVDYLKVGFKVPVKVIGVDDRGKVSLSIKQAKEGGMPELPADVERDVIEEPRGDRDRRPRARSGGRR